MKIQYNFGDIRQPCGVPVFKVKLEEVFLPIDNFAVMCSILYRGTIRDGLTIRLIRLQPWALKKVGPQGNTFSKMAKIVN